MFYYNTLIFHTIYNFLQNIKDFHFIYITIIYIIALCYIEMSPQVLTKAKKPDPCLAPVFMMLMTITSSLCQLFSIT